MSNEKEQTQQKLQFSVWQVVGIIISTVLLTIGGTVGVMNIVQTQPVTQTVATTYLPEKLVNGLARSYALLKNTYMGEIDDNKLIDGALAGFVNGVGDPYTSYLNDEAVKSLKEATEGSFEGIGVEIEQTGDIIRVVSPIEDSPAQKAGLNTDDVITAVNGESTKGYSVSELAQKVRGKKGTSVTLTISRQGSTFDVTIVRDTIPQHSIKAQLSTDDATVGIIRIRSFSKTTYDEMVEAVKKLRQDGAKSFVIDVRSNPGGLLDAVRDVVNMFVQPGQTMFKMADKTNGEVTYTAKNVTFTVTEPIVVLTNKGSASASEIFAAAMKDLNRGQVIGVTTFGKGTAQTILGLTQTTGIKITNAKWLTPNNDWVHEKGVTPTEEVQLPEYANYFLLNTKQIPQLKDTNDTVLNLQKILHAFGYDVQLTGTYDKALEQVVLQYHKDNNMNATTTLSEETVQKINTQLRQKVQENDTQLKRAIELLR